MYSSSSVTHSSVDRRRALRAGRRRSPLHDEIYRNTASINGKFTNVTVLTRASTYNDSVQNCLQFLNIFLYRVIYRNRVVIERAELGVHLDPKPH